MNARAHYQAAYAGRIRRSVWAVLAAALLLALLVPLLTLWRATSSPLSARACLWPAVPHAGATTYVLVALIDSADRTAVEGTWSQVSVAWDMASMRMGTKPQIVDGPPHNSGSFTIPIRLSMAGSWFIHVTLRTPGRPDWQAALKVTALPETTSGVAAPTQTDAFLPTVASRAPCGQTPSTA